MSVLDELTGLEDKVRSRMKELRPLLDEYSELQKAAERLGIATDATAQAPASTRRRAGGSRGRAAKPARAATSAADAAATAAGAEAAAPKAARASGKRSKNTKAGAKPSRSSSKTTTATAIAKKSRRPGGARSGARAEQLAALVRQRPGLTVKDAGAEFGVDPTSLYRIVKQLETDGKLEKRGRELHPA